MLTNEELLKELNRKFFGNKSLFTDSDLASGGLLNAKQFDKFIEETLQRAVIREECRRETGDEKQVKLDKIEFSELLIQTPVSEGSEHTTTTEPSTSQVSISTVEYIIAVNLGWSSLRNSIEKDNFENNLMQRISNKAGTDLEAVAVNSDTETGSDVYDDNDGWLALGAEDHEVDHESADFASTVDSTIELFDDMIDALPKEYLDGADLKAWRIYTHVDIEWLYRRWLTALGATHAGAMNYLIDNPPVFYQGFPVKGVPRFSRTSVTSPSSYYTSKAMLVNPQNLIEYIQTEMQFVSENKPRKRQIEITGTINIDWQIEETDACVVAKDIKHSLGTS
jgi:hypothetical protein